jgi:peptide methionine sulfoxide reductase MsrB
LCDFLAAFFMTERVIDAEIVEERIAVCPQCRQKNRLYQRSANGIYRCGACRATLRNPFFARARQSILAMPVLGYVTASVLGLLVLVAIIAGSESSPKSQPVHPLAAVPPANAPATVTPTNNEILFDAFPESVAHGELTVSNGSSRHAVAKLISTQNDRKILSFAICAGKQSTLYAIPDGSYHLVFAFGDRLYLGTDRFESPRGFSKFNKTFSFNTTKTDDGTHYGIRYTTLAVTLTPVIGGNVTTSTMSQGEFEKY